MDADMVNDLAAEEKQYRLWVKEQKSTILRMTNPIKKQEAWSKLFPPFEMTDEYLEGEIF